MIETTAPNPPSRRRPWLTVAAGVLAALIAAIALMWLLTSASPPGAAGPRALWAARGFTRYQITLLHGGLVACRVVAEVDGSQVVRRSDYPSTGSCNNVPITVEDLFSAIDTIAAHGPRCGPNGCACDGPIELTVNYDVKLGYPTLIDDHLRPDLRWQYPDYWVSLLPVPSRGCTLVGYLGQKIEVESLTPLR